MDQGVSLDATLEAMASHHAPLHEDGSERYGFAQVRQATYDAGVGDRFDGFASAVRAQAKQEQAQAASLGSRLRRAFSRR